MSPSRWTAGPVRIDFRGSPRPTLGVEWEFALVDQKTRDLTNSAADLFAAVGPDLPDQDRLHKELLRNTVEVVTGVCGSVGDRQEHTSELQSLMRTPSAVSFLKKNQTH